MGETSVMKCHCKSEYQDEKHGPGMRVHNITGNGDYAVCAICLDKKAIKKGERKE